MPATEGPFRGQTALRGAGLALWVVAAAACPFAPPVAAGLLLLVLAVLVLSLSTGAGLGAGRRRSRPFWARVAGLAVIAGALGSVLAFVRALGSSEGGIEAIATGMALSLVPGVTGFVLAGLTVAFASRLDPVPAFGPAGRGFQAWLGRLLFLGLVAWAAWAPGLRAPEPHFVPRHWLLHGPALLVLAGAAAGFAALSGRAWRRLSAMAIALAGTLAALVGLVQALLGMAHVSIAEVTAGLQSVITACFASLVGLALVSGSGVPTEPGDRTDVVSSANTVATALFALVALLLLGVAFALVVTPMTKPA